MLRLLVVLLAIILVIGMLPTWRYSANWGYAPSGGVLLVAIIAAVILLSNRRGTIV